MSRSERLDGGDGASTPSRPVQAPMTAEGDFDFDGLVRHVARATGLPESHARFFLDFLHDDEEIEIVPDLNNPGRDRVRVTAKGRAAIAEALT